MNFKTIAFIIILISAAQVKGQFIKNKAIDANIGYGLSVPYDDVDVTGTGFYLQAEYVLSLSKWIDIRPYAGLILTKSDPEENGLPDKSTTNAVLIGGKTRITAPIPWIAPYIEIGVGGSIGSFKTITQLTNIDQNGFVFHVPFSIGLELGPRHNYDIAFTYYYQNNVKQSVRLETNLV